MSADAMDDGKVLIVEGYGHSREGLTASLRAAGLVVETAAEYLEAIRKIRSGHFAVAIIDVDLAASPTSELTGWDLARIFRALHPGGAVENDGAALLAGVADDHLFAVGREHGGAFASPGEIERGRVLAGGGFDNAEVAALAAQRDELAVGRQGWHTEGRVHGPA